MGARKDLEAHERKHRAALAILGAILGPLLEDRPGGSKAATAALNMATAAFDAVKEQAGKKS